MIVCGVTSLTIVQYNNLTAHGQISRDKYYVGEEEGFVGEASEMAGVGVWEMGDG